MSCVKYKNFLSTSIKMVLFLLNSIYVQWCNFNSYVDRSLVPQYVNSARIYALYFFELFLCLKQFPDSNSSPINRCHHSSPEFHEKNNERNYSPGSYSGELQYFISKGQKEMLIGNVITVRVNNCSRKHTHRLDEELSILDVGVSRVRSVHLELIVLQHKQQWVSCRG